MRIFLVIILLSSLQVFAQPSDFLVLKKHNKTIKRFYAGENIEMITKQGAYRNAIINTIRNDSLFLQEFLVQDVPTIWGSMIHDTLGSFRYAYHYKDILQIGKRKSGFDIRGSGVALLYGSALIALGSGVVYLTDRKRFSGELLLGGLALGAVGYILTKLGSKQIVMGKHGYKMQYVQVTPQ